MSNTENTDLAAKIAELDQRISELENLPKPDTGLEFLFDSGWIEIERGKSKKFRFPIDSRTLSSSEVFVSTLNRTNVGELKYDYCTKLEWNWEISDSDLKIRRLKNDNKFYRDRRKDEFRIIVTRFTE